MRYLFAILLSFASFASVAQTNFVKNPSFEKYDTCPVYSSQIHFATDWTNGYGGIDSLLLGRADYFNFCTDTSSVLDADKIPNNLNFYQYPHSANRLAAIQMYYDKMPLRYLLSPPQPFSYREHLQGRLQKNLIAGKSYCVAFWVNLAEAAGYGQNKIGAYLDDGDIRILIDSPNKEVNTVTPQVYTDSIIIDTMNWVKIEGSFVANGTETYITIGNFFPNAAVSTIVTNYYHVFEHESFYVVDDVSVVATDTKANAGPDRWVAIGNSTDMGPVEDSTARGMDCHWYYKGSLIDSGNVITVNAASSINQIDTYVVVQNVCGTITRDTMLLKTTSLGISEISVENAFNVFPNPAQQSISLPIAASKLVVYNTFGQIVLQAKDRVAQQPISVSQLSSGMYFVAVFDKEQNQVGVGKFYKE